MAKFELVTYPHEGFYPNFAHDCPEGDRVRIRILWTYNAAESHSNMHICILHRTLPSPPTVYRGDLARYATEV